MRPPALTLLALGTAATAWIACSSEVTQFGTSSTTSTSSSSDGGAGGAGGATTIGDPSTAIGGCFDSDHCGNPLVMDGNCSSCESEACPDELAACEASDRCLAYSDCADACADTACIDGCITMYPGGAMLHQALVACTACKDSCSSKGCPQQAYPAVTCP